MTVPFFATVGFLFFSDDGARLFVVCSIICEGVSVRVPQTLFYRSGFLLLSCHDLCDFNLITLRTPYMFSKLAF